VALDRFSVRKPATQSRARETIDAILEASSRIVNRQGLAGLTTNRVAEMAGVSIGSLYQYFPGRDAVLHALVQREFNRTVDAAVAHIESIDPATTTLEQAVSSIVDHVFQGQMERKPFYRQVLLSVLSIKHLRFTLENDTRVLAAVRGKLAAYSGVDAETLDDGTFVALYALKGVQIGVLFSDGVASETLRAAVSRALVACVRGNRPGTC
jgi:AcrR family transcriptional regulator